MIKTRFAPSPTGFLHMGGARTALFSWLYARKYEGKFLLRIEDTDLQRSRQEYIDEILTSLKWLGIDWDEVIYQSERFSLYQEYAQKLKQKGLAYEKEGAVFFRYNFNQIEVEDLIRGKIVFKELPKPEDVIIKSDGSPAYNFCCVIDDALLGITHVIRGEDHISNTPKQILLYKALEFDVPFFAHLPLILSPGGGRMSKRFGATAISEYRKQGYLPQALVNFLLLLGWSPGDNQEIFSLDLAQDRFELKDVNKSGAKFLLDKLDWLNAHYIKSASPQELLGPAREILEEAGVISKVSDEYLCRVIKLFQGRINKLSDLVEWAAFCFRDDVVYESDEKTRKILANKKLEEIELLRQNISRVENFCAAEIEFAFRKTSEALEEKLKDLVHPVRIALTGRRIGPGLFETIEVLGKEKTLRRIENLLNYWRQNDD